MVHKKLNHILAIVLFVGLTTACGFQPLYQGSSGDGPVGTGLSQVAIVEPRDRTAQIVYIELLQLLEVSGRGDKIYQLHTSYTEQQLDLAIQLDDSVTRRNLILRTKFRLEENATGKTIFEAAGRSYAAYNLVQSDYANLIAERDARDRAAKELAYQIRTRLATYFASRKKTS